MKKNSFRFGTLLTALAVGGVLTLSACDSMDAEQRVPRGPSKSGPRSGAPTYDGEQESIFGPGGLTLFGADNQKPAEEGTGTGVAVNAYLWRGALDTIAFMPLSSADPFGGVIITDWYTPPEAANERFKVNVYILTRALRADGLKVSVFRQVRDAAGGWTDTPVGPEVATDIENQILTRARQLRIAGMTN